MQIRAVTSVGFLAAGMLASTMLTPLSAAPLTTSSKIEQVTLYPDAAMITRKARFELNAGSHELRFEDLPALMDPASLRISGEGTAAIRLGALDIRKSDKPHRATTERAEKRRQLTAEIARLRDKIDALEGRKAMIRRLTESNSESKITAAEIEAVIRASETVAKGLLAVNEELRNFANDLQTREEALAALDAAENAAPQQQQKQVVIIPLELASAAKGELTITYRVSGAAWRPVYDARLDTRGPKAQLAFTRRALVRQQTGEAWEGASLTLSTLRASRGTSAPDLRPGRVEFVPPPRPMPIARAAEPQAMAMAAADNMAKTSQREATPPRQIAEEASAELAASPFQSEFLIPGKTTLPSGSEEKSLRLQEEALEPNLTHRSVPMIDPAAYLEARIAPKLDAPILAGEIFLHRDGAFIGRSRLANRAAGEAFSLGFGADERILVTRVPVQKEAREPGLLSSTRSEESKFRIDAKNLHAFPVSLVIEDRLPISEDSAIEVQRLPDMTKPDQEGLEDKRGVIGWTLALKPQEGRSLITGYRLRWPQGRDIRQITIRN